MSDCTFACGKTTRIALEYPDRPSTQTMKGSATPHLFRSVKDHAWYMETLASVCRAEPELLLATDSKMVNVTDPASDAEGFAWWTELRQATVREWW